MNGVLTVLGSTLACAAIGYGMEALFDNHDPGAVFPWGFVAFLMGIAGAIAGLALGLIIVLIRWLYQVV